MKLLQPKLREFLFLSLMIHLIIGQLSGNLFLYKKEIEVPIQVRFVDLQKEKKADFSFKKGNFIEISKPKKAEKPITESALSMYNSRAHGNKNAVKKDRYKSSRSFSPQSKSELKPITKKKTSEKKPVFERKESEKKELKKAEKTSAVLKGLFIQRDNQQKEEEDQEEYSIFKGFDPEKLAKLDTGVKEDESDTTTVSLDSQEFKYASYFASIKRRIETAWLYPEQAAINGLRGELLLQFILDRSGKLIDIFLINSSSHKILDDAAFDAVKIASPYNPFPSRIQKKKLRIIATFTYKPFYTLY